MLGAFTMVALILAILAVLPEVQGAKVGDGPLPQGSICSSSATSRGRASASSTRSRAMASDGSVYRAMADDLYSLGYYLAHYKVPLTCVMPMPSAHRIHRVRVGRGGDAAGALTLALGLLRCSRLLRVGGVSAPGRHR
ncbi:MAG: hypothetical protein IPH76_14635 [Xanthomonadales bacterium]|nr:hypothetical protein [Xanthomonadales bacterium]